MKMRFIAAAVAAAAGAAVLALPADAGQRHWYFGYHGPYQPQVFIGGFWGPPPLPPRAYAPPAYYQDEPEFYYEVAPGQYVPVYGNDGEMLAPDGRDGSLVNYEPQRKRAAPQPRRKLGYVPLPRPKPTVPLKVEDEVALRVEDEVPQEDVAETPAPAEKLSGPSISCAKARQIVGDFGFTDIETVGCVGKEYGFRAKRDGKVFEVRLSSLTGELVEVKRR